MDGNTDVARTLRDEEVDDTLKRASSLFSRGRYHRAERAYRTVVAQRPEELRAVAGVAICEASTGAISYESALERVQRLVDEHPDDERLPVTVIGLLDRMGRKADAGAARERYLERYPDSAMAQQLWANFFQVNSSKEGQQEAQEKAWSYYKLALAQGPLLTPCFKIAAHYAAKKAEPTNARLALQGSNLVERQAIRTRTAGPRAIMGVLFVGVFVSLLLRPSNLAASIVAQTMTVAWAGWCAYANDLACCKKCRNVWLFFAGYLASLAVVLDDRRVWYFVAILAAIVVAVAAATGNLNFERPQSRDGSKNQSLV